VEALLKAAAAAPKATASVSVAAPPAVPVTAVTPPAPARRESHTEGQSHQGKKLYVTVNGARHEVTVETLHG